MATVGRAVVKGWLAGVVQTRSIFTFDLEVVAPDLPGDVISPYLGSIFNPLNAYLSTIWQVASYDRYNLSGTQWDFQEEISWNYQGGSGSDALPNFTAIPLIAKAAGIKELGRKFIPGVAENAVAGNALVAAALIAAASSALGYITLYTTANGSFLSPGILNKSGVFRPFVSGVVSALLGTMRRRKPGLGI